MRKVSYEAWAIVRGGQLATEGHGYVLAHPDIEYMKFVAGFAPLQKVRVTIEPVNKTKQRRLHGTRKRKANSERTKG